MPRLKAIVKLLLLALFATGFVRADDKDVGNQRAEVRPSKSNGPAPLPPNPARIERFLKQWEDRSAQLKTLEFSIYQIDRDPKWNERHYEGHAAFKSPKLAYRDVRTVKLVADGNKKMVPQLDTSKKRVSTARDTLVWSGEELWLYHYERKLVVIFQLDKYLGLRKPEEAPLPFVFNIKAADVRRRYDMVLLEEDAKRYLVKVNPKDPEDQSFNTAWIVLDAKSFLPSRILLLLPDKKSTEDFTLSQFRVNQPVNESFFHVVIPGKPWKVERFPGGQAQARINGPSAKRPSDGPAPRALESDAGQP